MNLPLLALAANLSSATCVVAAAVLAYHDRGGWVWFLLTAILLHAGVEWKSGGGK